MLKTANLPHFLMYRKNPVKWGSRGKGSPLHFAIVRAGELAGGRDAWAGPAAASRTGGFGHCWPRVKRATPPRRQAVRQCVEPKKSSSSWQDDDGRHVAHRHLARRCLAG